MLKAIKVGDVVLVKAGASTESQQHDGLITRVISLSDGRGAQCAIIDTTYARCVWVSELTLACSLAQVLYSVDARKGLDRGQRIET